MRSESGLPGQPPDREDDRPFVEREGLSFRVELWDVAKTGIERVLAEVSHASIAYAAYNAAIQEHPDRYVVLRRRGRILSSCNAPRVSF